jgi:uncharacterized membrane protein
MIVGHNLLDRIQSANPIWSILHSPGMVWSDGQHFVFALYPLIPWVGVTAAGYGLGQIFKRTPERRQAFLLRLGLGLTGAFVALRAINIYGDPFRWSPQKSAVFTLLSFLNTNKYPPSLLYLLMTLGPAMLFLRAVEGGVPRWLRPALLVGKAPMFYYLLHIPLIHIIAVIVCDARYGQAHWMFESPSIEYFPFTRPPGWGYSLPVIYLIWAFVVVALYPLCKWYAGLRQRSSNPWLSYL